MHTRWVPDRVPGLAPCRALLPTPRPARSSTEDGVAHEPQPRPSPDHRRRRRRVSRGTGRRAPYGPGAADRGHPPGRPLQATEKACPPLDRQQRRTPGRAQHDALHTKRLRLAARQPPRPSGRPAGSPRQLVGNRLSNRLPRHNPRLARDDRQRPTLDLLRPGNLEPVVALTGRALKTCEQLSSQLRPLLVSKRQRMAPNILGPHCHGPRLAHRKTTPEGTPVRCWQADYRRTRPA